MSVAKHSPRLGGSLKLAFLASTALVVVAASPAAAQTFADWNAAPTTGDLNTAGNWTQGFVPTDGFFRGSTITTLTDAAASATFGSLNFQTGAPLYTFNNANAFTFNGAGIVVGTGLPGISINNTTATSSLTFNGGTAGNATLSNQVSGSAITFQGSSNAGSAVIHNSGGTVTFQDSNAGSATIDQANGGQLIFKGTSTAGSASLKNDANISLVGSSLIDVSQASNANFTAGSIAGGGLLSLGGTNLIVGNNNTSTTFSGTIRDFGFQLATGGALTKVGTGTLTLTGANSYSGGTFINGGVLSVSSDSNLGAATLNNVGTTIGFVGGALQFTNRSDITLSSTRTLGVLGGGTIDLEGAGNVNFGGTIGPGSLTVINNMNGSGGSLNLSGTVTASIINNGTVGLNGANMTGLLTNNATANVDASTIGAVVNAGNLFFNQIVPRGTVTTTSTLQNSGVIQLGGTVNVGDVLRNTNIGVINVVGGTLNAPKGILNAGQISVFGNGNTTNVLGNAVVNDDLTNSGTVTNNGTFNGNVASNTGTITNNAVWTGNVMTSGTFVNNGAINGVVTVGGGSFTGAGSIGTLNISSGASLIAGNGTAGTSTVINGSLAFASGAAYVVALNPTTSSFTTVAGTATLGGATVNASFANGSYVTRQYTIVNASGGVTGSFGTLANTNLPAGFTSTLSTDATHAYLNLALNFTPPTTTTTPIPQIAPVNSGLNVNQRNVGNTIVNFFNTNGSIPIVFGALTPTTLTQVSGETVTGAQQTTFNAMSMFMGTMMDPFLAGRGDPLAPGTSGPSRFADEDDAASAYAASGRKRSGAERDAYAAIYRKAPIAAFVPSWSTWAAGYGGSQTTDGNAALGSNTATSSIYAVAAGADYRLSTSTTAGFSLAGGGTNFGVANGGTGRSDLFQAGAFVRHSVGAAYISAAAAYGWQNITTDRAVTVSGVDRLHANFNANAYSGRVESGYRFVAPWIGGVGITPYAAAQVTAFDLPGYAEQVISGVNTFALAYAAKTVTDTRSELGLHGDKSYAMTTGVLTLRGRAAWAHDYNPDRSIAATFQTLPGSSFVVNGAQQAREAALTTASIEYKWRSGWSTAANFEGEFSQVTRSYAGKGVVRYAW